MKRIAYCLTCAVGILAVALCAMYPLMEFRALVEIFTQ